MRHKFRLLAGRRNPDPGPGMEPRPWKRSRQEAAESTAPPRDSPGPGLAAPRTKPGQPWAQPRSAATGPTRSPQRHAAPNTAQTRFGHPSAAPGKAPAKARPAPPLPTQASPAPSSSTKTTTWSQLIFKQQIELQLFADLQTQEMEAWVQRANVSEKQLRAVQRELDSTKLKLWTAENENGTLKKDNTEVLAEQSVIKAMNASLLVENANLKQELFDKEDERKKQETLHQALKSQVVQGLSELTRVKRAMFEQLFDNMTSEDLKKLLHAAPTWLYALQNEKKKRQTPVCIACQDEQAVFFMWPCSCASTCLDCHDDFWKHFKQNECPRCRETVKGDMQPRRLDTILDE